MRDNPIDDVDELAFFLRPSAHRDHRRRHRMALDVEAIAHEGAVGNSVSSPIVTSSTTFIGACRSASLIPCSVEDALASRRWPRKH